MSFVPHHNIMKLFFTQQVGAVIDKFCPEIISKEYILNTTEKKIVIR